MPTQNIFDLTDTWNAGATNFTAIKMNVTDTASAAGSLLIDLQVGGATRFSVNKSGSLALVAGSKTTPAVAFSGATGGIYGRAGAALCWGSAGSEFGYLGASGILIQSSATFAFSSSTPDAGGGDTVLARDAANTLAQRNGTNAQAFRLYNTFTDANNYERGFMLFSSNVFQIGTEAAGTGGGRSMQFRTAGVGRWTIEGSGNLTAVADNTYDIGASGANRPRTLFLATSLVLGGSSKVEGTNGVIFITGIGESLGGASNYLKSLNGASFTIGTNNTDRWSVANAGHFVPAADNVYDIGASGTARARNIFAGNAILSGGLLEAGSSSPIRFGTNRTQLQASADSMLLLQNAAGNNFDRLQLGGTTNSFPAVKRDGAGVSIVGGADGSTAHIKVPGVTVASLPAAATAGVGARSFVTDALSPVFGSAVTGGGAVPVPVYSTGSAWHVG